MRNAKKRRASVGKKKDSTRARAASARSQTKHSRGTASKKRARRKT